MSAPPATDSRILPDDAAFRVLWAVAMSGHRDLPDEAKAREAVKAELMLLMRAAEKEDARLVSVSSIARGADLIFAEECLAAGLPWKCLLPFPREEFQKDGFSAEEWSRVENCLARAYRIEAIMTGIPPDREARDLAYRECGHRTVEAGDVMMILWDGSPPKKTGGSAEMVEYARTLNKPVWHWHPGTQLGRRLGWPGEKGEWENRQLFHSRVTPLLHEAAGLTDPFPQSGAEPGVPPRSTMRRGLEALFRRIDHLALRKQGDAQKLMQRVVFSHLLATTAAALSVTIFAAGCWHSLEEKRWLAAGAALIFSSLVLVKPMFAALALFWERRLHLLRAREHWVEARVAAELCRSALQSWGFPQAPLALFNEEDFPHFKRLIRTLRTAREIDTPTATTLDEEGAIALYTTARLDGEDGQIRYFTSKQGKAATEYALWQRRFNTATWTVIIVGAIFGIAESLEAYSSVGPVHGADHEGLLAHGLHYFGPPASFVLIVAPFYASYALAVLSIRDCRRRCDRFKAMKEYLERQKKRLHQIKSPASRIAVVENTERMLLEELHEWYSIMRSVRV